MAKCNLAPQLRDEYLHAGFWQPDDDSLESCRSFFQNFLFVECGVWEAPKDRAFKCSACGDVWQWQKTEAPEFFSLHHGDECRCPHCGEMLNVQMLSRVRCGKSLHQTEAVNFINVTESGAAAINSGIVFYDFNMCHDVVNANMDIYFIGKVRTYIEPGAVMQWHRHVGTEYEREVYGVGEWEERRNICEPFNRNPLCGYDGYARVIGAEKLMYSTLKYSAVDKYFSEYHNTDVFEHGTLIRLLPQYLAEYALNPKIEMIVKLGMPEAVGELLRDGIKNNRYLNWNAKDPAGFVRLSKSEAKEFYHAPSLEFLRWYKNAAARGKIKNIQEARELANLAGYPSGNVVDVCERYGIPLIKAARKYGSEHRVRLWADYVEAAEKLKYDLARMDVLMPRDLEQRHDAAIANVKYQNAAKEQAKYDKRRKKLEKKYGFTMDGLTIVVPRSTSEIILEGKTLKICVGGYAARHVDGKTTILFLRHARRPERSFLCIEIDERNRIVQIHGYKNEHYKAAVAPSIRYKAWLDAWLAWVKAGSPRDRNGHPTITERKKETA